jgi:hypothetical protein
LGLTVTAAVALGVTRTTLSELVNEKHGISPEMAVRLSSAVRQSRKRNSKGKGQKEKAAPPGILTILQ